MAEMGLQERYEDICRISGLSEDIVRRVLKASRQSLAKSLKKGSRATLPGICTAIPEIKHKVELGGTEIASYVKIKTVPSNALSSEMGNISKFEEVDNGVTDNGISRLNLKDPELPSYRNSNNGIRTNQISALI